MIRVALATHAGLPALTDDELLTVRALRAHGVEASPAVWDDPLVDWAAYAAVIVRSCWDYHFRLPEFLAWVGRLEADGIAVWNPPAVLRWNAEKTYLRELSARGVSVVPTHWVEPGAGSTLNGVLDDAGWDQVVVKPAVSASAHDTWRTSRASASADEVRFRALVARGRVLVQPFLPTVGSEGEWSLMFFGGVYSHAVLKRPRPGDFRVQAEHGGAAEAGDPGARMVADALGALAAAPGGAAGSVYARVDGCMVDGRFMLMELELIEPALFLSAHPDAPSRFAVAVMDRVGMLLTEEGRRS